MREHTVLDELARVSFDCIQETGGHAGEGVRPIFRDCDGGAFSVGTINQV